MGHESDGDAWCKWCPWNNFQRTGRIKNWKTNGGHPDYSIKINRNTEKSPANLRGLAVTQNPVKKSSANAEIKNSQKSKIVIIHLKLCMSRAFANVPGDLGSIPDRFIPKTLKMVLDTSMLNTQQYKVHIKGKVEHSKERSRALPYTSVLQLLKREPSGRPRPQSPTLLFTIRNNRSCTNQNLSWRTKF